MLSKCVFVLLLMPLQKPLPASSLTVRRHACPAMRMLLWRAHKPVARCSSYTAGWRSTPSNWGGTKLAEPIEAYQGKKRRVALVVMVLAGPFLLTMGRVFRVIEVEDNSAGVRSRSQCNDHRTPARAEKGRGACQGLCGIERYMLHAEHKQRVVPEAIGSIDAYHILFYQRLARGLCFFESFGSGVTSISGSGIP